MFSVRTAPLLPLLLAVGCAARSAAPRNERALIDNELCAQQIVQGNLTQAEDYCDQGLQLEPKSAELWSNKGLIAMQAGDAKLAREHLLKAVRYDPELAIAHMNLGRVYLDERAYGKAHDSLQRALKINPDYADAHYNLGLCFINMDRLEDAEREFHALLAAEPDNAQVHHEMGLVRYRQDAKGEAEQEMAKAVKLAPSANPDWWNDLGAVQLELGRSDLARQSFSSCVNLKSDHAQCLNNLSIAQRKAALSDPDLKEFRDTQKAENTPESLLALARKYKEQGLLSEEERTYKDCLKVDGKFPACHWGLFQIYSGSHKSKAAEAACKNFVKYASVEDFPTEMETCEKFLNAQSY